MKLYHGSNTQIRNINISMCRPYKDFGKGFYLTDIKEQAERMAIRVSKIYGGNPVLNIFEIQDDFIELPNMNIKNEFVIYVFFLFIEPLPHCNT